MFGSCLRTCTNHIPKVSTWEKNDPSRSMIYPITTSWAEKKLYKEHQRTNHTVSLSHYTNRSGTNHLNDPSIIFKNPNHIKESVSFIPPHTPTIPSPTCSLVCHPPPLARARAVQGPLPPRKGVPLLAPAVTPDPSRHLWVLQRRRRPWWNIGVLRWFNDHDIIISVYHSISWYIIAYHGISWYTPQKWLIYANIF